MKTLFLIFILCLTTVSAQNRNELYEPGVSDNLRLSIALVTDDQNVTRSGLLLDYYQDSLKIFSNNVQTSIHINNITRVDILNASSPHKWSIAGFLGGFYLGHIALFTESEQNGNYRSTWDKGFWQYLVNIVIAAAGGALGYLYSEATNDDRITFIFAGDIEREKERFARFLLEGSSRSSSRINITFQAGSVDTKFSKIYEKTSNSYGYYNYSNFNELSNFNLLRKLQANYIFNDYLQLGIAINWITEPDITWSSGNYYTSQYVTGTQSLEGVGYFAAVEVQPFFSFLPSSVFISLGGLAGIMKLDYRSSFQGSSTDPAVPPATGRRDLSKSSFCGGGYGSIGFHLNEVLNLAFIGDYLYVPGETTAVPEIGLEAMPFTTYSLGFSIGFNF